jgi:hypothetical protein
MVQVVFRNGQGCKWWESPRLERVPEQKCEHSLTVMPKRRQVPISGQRLVGGSE